MPASEPGLVLSGPPSAPASPSLADVAAAITGQPLTAPNRLWPSPSRLRRGGTASFLLLVPTADDDLGGARLEAVWIDGVEVTVLK